MDQNINPQPATQQTFQPVQQQVQQAPQFPQQPQPPTERKTKSNTGLIVFLIIFLLALGGASGFLYYQNTLLKQLVVNQANQSPTATPAIIEPQSPSPTPSTNSNWITYTSSSYSVKFPRELIQYEDPGSVLRLIKTGPKQTQGTELFDGFSLQFQPLEASGTLDQLVDAKIQEIQKIGVSEVIASPSPTTLNSYTGKTYTVRGLGVYKNIILYSEKSKKFLQISYLVEDPGKLGFQQTIDDILSTFSFKE